MGVQAWLKRISKENSDPASTFKLLTDSHVTLQSVQKAIKQPATTWLCTNEPILADVVSRRKILTEGGHRIRLGKVVAHTGVVSHKHIDARGNFNLIPDEGLEAAGIDDACKISTNAHEHHEWPVHPIPKQEGMDVKALLEMQGLLKDL